MPATRALQIKESLLTLGFRVWGSAETGTQSRVVARKHVLEGIHEPIVLQDRLVFLLGCHSRLLSPVGGFRAFVNVCEGCYGYRLRGLFSTEPEDWDPFSFQGPEALTRTSNNKQLHRHTCDPGISHWNNRLTCLARLVFFMGLQVACCALLIAGFFETLLAGLRNTVLLLLLELPSSQLLELLLSLLLGLLMSGQSSSVFSHAGSPALCSAGWGSLATLLAAGSFCFPVFRLACTIGASLFGLVVC